MKNGDMYRRSAPLLLMIILSVLIDKYVTKSPSILELLDCIGPESSAVLEERCIAYEECARKSVYGPIFNNKSRHQIYKAIIENDTPSDEDIQRSIGEKSLLSGLHECLNKLDDSPAPEVPAIDGDVDNWGSRELSLNPEFTLSQKNVFSLSKVQRDTKSVPLEQRCQLFHDKLSSILGSAQSADAQPSWLFERAIKALGSRRLPFGNRDPVLDALTDCVEKLPEYYLKIQSQASASDRPIGPSSPSREFSNKVDEEGAQYCTRQDMLEVTMKLKQLTQAHRDLSARFEAQLGKLEAIEMELLQLKQRRDSRAQHDGIVSDEDDQIKRPEEGLRRGPQEGSSSGTAMLDDSIALERSRHEMTKSLYQQVYDREIRTNKRLKEAEERIAQLIREHERERDELTRDHQAELARLAYELEREKTLSKSLRSLARNGFSQ